MGGIHSSINIFHVLTFTLRHPFQTTRFWMPLPSWSCTCIRRSYIAVCYPIPSRRTLHIYCERVYWRFGTWPTLPLFTLRTTIRCGYNCLTWVKRHVLYPFPIMSKWKGENMNSVKRNFPHVKYATIYLNHPDTQAKFEIETPCGGNHPTPNTILMYSVVLDLSQYTQLKAQFWLLRSPVKPVLNCTNTFTIQFRYTLQYL